MYLREFLLKFNHPITQYNTRQINTKVRVTGHKSVNTDNRSSIWIVSIFMYLSVLYDVDIEASACVLSSRYATLC